MHLLVVLEDRISDWTAKGEILEGYFNPDAAFETITVLSLIADQPDPNALARLCAPAHCLHISAGIDRRYLALSTLGLRYGLLSRSMRALKARLDVDAPQVIRGYGDGLGAIAASILADQTGIPFVVSLHTTPDPLIQSRYLGFRDRIWRQLAKSSLSRALQNADGIIAVYSSIMDYLPAKIAEKAKVIPNVVGIGARSVQSPRETPPLKLIWVSRQMPGRDPRPVIGALMDLPEAELTLVGDGPLHQAAQRMIAMAGLDNRVHVVPALENQRLCSILCDHDLMLVNSGFREIPKSVLEASLCGLPILVNRYPAETTVEYGHIPAIFVDGCAESYRDVIRDLIGDPGRLLALGRQTRKQAWEFWNPQTAGFRAAEMLRNLAMSRRE